MSIDYITDLSANITDVKAMGNELDYHTELVGEKALKENLQKLHHSLNEDNIFSLAYLILNPITSEEEKDRLKTRLHNKIEEMRDMKIPVMELINTVEEQTSSVHCNPKTPEASNGFVNTVEEQYKENKIE